MKKNSLRAGILGGTGYTGVELLRLLSGHPHATPRCITSRAVAGQKVAEVFPSLRGHTELAFSAPEDAALSDCDVVFCATPNGIAMQHTAALLDAGVKVIDLSADFRLRDVRVWEQWYGAEHGAAHAAPALLAEAVYGLPEIHRERIRSARLVANPGCYPTAVQLGYLPLMEEGLVDTDSLIADVKSGVSGAGRRAALATALGEAGDSFKAYGASGHRHQPEIAQGLSDLAGTAVAPVFIPHLVPMIRGIHATLYARLRRPEVDLQALYARRFAAEPFIDVLPAGAHPDTRSVRGANMCRMAVHRPDGGDTVVVLVVEDNLVKGAAGQAIQNMNLMFDVAEATGLEGIALVP